MNLPNKLTVGRLFLTAVFVGVMSVELPWSPTLALALFVVASITDYLDGRIARSRGQITNFGKLMDPLVDKVLLCSAFVLLSERGWIPGWVVVAVIAREFLVTGLRLIASAQGTVLAAEALGKHKTILQIAAAIYFLLHEAMKEPLAGHLAPLFAWPPLSPTWFGNALIILMAAATIGSGLSYFVKNRTLVADA